MAKGKFTPELAAKLKEAAQRKRRLNPKACDYEPADWLMAADWVKENTPERWDGDDAVTSNGGRALIWVPAASAEALATTVPTVKVCYSAYGNTVIRHVFPEMFLTRVLIRLNLNVGKYSRYWSSKNIKRCLLTKENAP